MIPAPVSVFTAGRNIVPTEVGTALLLVHSVLLMSTKIIISTSCNMSSMRASVSSPDETPRRELKIRHAAEYF